MNFVVSIVLFVTTFQSTSAVSFRGHNGNHLSGHDEHRQLMGNMGGSSGAGGMGSGGGGMGGGTASGGTVSGGTTGGGGMGGMGGSGGGMMVSGESVPVSRVRNIVRLMNSNLNVTPMNYI